MFSDICPDGFELQFDGICVPCEKNYYRTQGKQLQCTACPDEFITFYEGSKSVDDCQRKLKFEFTQMFVCINALFLYKLYKPLHNNCQFSSVLSIYKGRSNHMGTLTGIT